MRKILIFLFAITLFSCKQEQKEYVILKGKVESQMIPQLHLNGPNFSEEIALGEGGAFSDTLWIKKDGFYDLTFGRVMQLEIYLEKGKELDLVFDETQPDNPITFTGSLAKENNLLAERTFWFRDELDYQELFGSDESAFKSRLDEIENSLSGLYKKHPDTGKKFNELLKKEDSYFRATMIENYEGAHRYYSQNPGFTASTSFYDELKDFDFSDTLSFRNSATYRNLVETHYSRVVGAESPAGSPEFLIPYLTKIDNEFPQGYAKEELMANYLQYGLKPDEHMEAAFEIFKRAEPSAENLSRFEQQYSKFLTLLRGNPSPTFNYENYKGGTTSLEDLRGKYVYIDVWATWCAPCLREIPSLQEVEKDYKNKNLQVVSISIDEPKAYDKWREMIEENSLGGIQLMSDNNWASQFVQDYGIQGIPRFILVDPEGNIVSADAPRPSDPALRILLDGLL